MAVLVPLVLGLLTPMGMGETEGAAEELVLAGSPQSPVIVYRDGWERTNWKDFGAHVLLARFLNEITGESVPVLSESVFRASEETFDPVIWVGRQPEVEKVMGARLDALDDDGFIIKAEGKNVYLAGKHWWGDIWAVYDLLETYAGCRWYGPREPKGLDGEVVGLFDIVPQAAQVRIPAPLERVEEPAYKSRLFPNTTLHSFRERRRDEFHHNMGRILDPRKFGKSHPEVFPLVDGKPLLDPPDILNNWHPIVSEPKTLELTLDYIRQYFKDHPDKNSVSLGMNDGGPTSEADLKLAPKNITESNERMAWAWFDFYNQVGRAVAAEFPGKRLGCLAYSTLSFLPQGSLKLEDNIIPYVTRDSAQLFDPREQEEFRETVDKWSQITPRMGIYEYMYGGGFLIPRIYNRYLIPNIQNRYGVGVDGFYAEVYPNWGLDGPKYWLTAKMLWDNTTNPQELLNQYYADLFGPAAEEMEKYFDFLEDVWCTQTLPSPRSNYRWLGDPKQIEIFPPATCQKALKILDQAESIAKQSKENAVDPKILERIAFFKDTFLFTTSISIRYHSLKEAEHLWAAQDVPLPERRLATLKALETWFAKPTPEEAVAKVKEWGSLPFLNNFIRYEWRIDLTEQVLTKATGSPVPVVNEIVEELIREAAEEYPEASFAELKKQAGARIRSEYSEVAGEVVESFLLPALDANLMEIPAVSGPLTIDGVIEEAGWGDPINERNFFDFNTLRSSSDPSKMYARVDGDILYLAFDFKEPAEGIRADVKGEDQQGWHQPAMSQDDSVVVGFVSDREGPQQTLRINANGTVGSHQERTWTALIESAVGRSESGWQTELMIDLQKTWLAKAVGDRLQIRMPVVRYNRVFEEETAHKVPRRTNLSSFSPMNAFGKIIGSGNFPNLMIFKTGPFVELGGSEPRTVNSQ